MGVVVVTGSSRGLGRGLAEAFVAAGHEVHGFSRSTGVDVRDAAAVESFAAGIGRPIDLWVNNAGILGPLVPVAEADFREALDVDVVGAVHGTQAFLRHRAPEGVLVNISSGAATRPYARWGPYCAAKAALEMITEVVAVEEGIRAYAVAPGVVETDMQVQLRAAGLAPDRRPNSPAWVASHLLDVAFGPERPPVRWRVPDEG